MPGRVVDLQAIEDSTEEVDDHGEDQERRHRPILARDNHDGKPASCWGWGDDRFHGD